MHWLGKSAFSYETIGVPLKFPSQQSIDPQDQSFETKERKAAEAEWEPSLRRFDATIDVETPMGKAVENDPQSFCFPHHHIYVYVTLSFLTYNIRNISIFQLGQSTTFRLGHGFKFAITWHNQVGFGSSHGRLAGLSKLCGMILPLKRLNGKIWNTKAGWWFQTWLLFSIIYGMSSFPLTFIFFKMVIAPPTRKSWSNPVRCVFDLLCFVASKKRSWCVMVCALWSIDQISGGSCDVVKFADPNIGCPKFNETTVISRTLEPHQQPIRGAHLFCARRKRFCSSFWREGLSGRFASNVSRNSLGLCGKDFAAKFVSSKMLVWQFLGFVFSI